MADILGYKDTRSIYRLEKAGHLPPRVPNIKKFLWYRDVVHDWIKAGYQMDKEKQAILIATALGWPVDIMTMNGQNLGYLIGVLQKHGHLEGDPPQEIVDDLI